jgi:hypothetical protein
LEDKTPPLSKSVIKSIKPPVYCFDNAYKENLSEPEARFAGFEIPIKTLQIKNRESYFPCLPGLGLAMAGRFWDNA